MKNIFERRLIKMFAKRSLKLPIKFRKKETFTFPIFFKLIARFNFWWVRCLISMQNILDSFGIDLQKRNEGNRFLGEDFIFEYRTILFS